MMMMGGRTLESTMKKQRHSLLVVVRQVCGRYSTSNPYATTSHHHQSRRQQQQHRHQQHHHQQQPLFGFCRHERGNAFHTAPRVAPRSLPSLYCSLTNHNNTLVAFLHRHENRSKMWQRSLSSSSSSSSSSNRYEQVLAKLQMYHQILPEYYPTSSSPSSSVPNWKDWFPPAEYENPWQQQHIPLSQPQHQHQLPQQQQHLLLSGNPPVVSNGIFSPFAESERSSDSNNSHGRDEQGAGNTTTTSGLFQLDKYNYYATLHAIQLLRELFHSGQYIGDERVTTERCNHVLEQQLILLQRAIKKTSLSSSSTSTKTGPPTPTLRLDVYAHRAYSLLKTMQLFEDLKDRIRTATAAAAASAAAVSVLGRPVSTTSSVTIGSLPRLGPTNDDEDGDNNNHHRRTLYQHQQHYQPAQAFEFPCPDRNTYHLVLQIWSKTPQAPGWVAMQAQEVVQDHLQIHRYQRHGDIALRPDVVHWNWVLMAWYESLQWDRPYHAAKLFLQLFTQQHDQQQQQQDEQQQQQQSPQHSQLLDVSSYIWMMRICAHKHINSKAEQLGAQVAATLWHQCLSRAPPHSFKSHFYSIFMQAIRRLPPSVSPSSTNHGTAASHDTSNPDDTSTSLVQLMQRDEYFDWAFTHACQHGKVNAVVLQEFLVHCQSASIFGKHLGPYKDLLRGKPPEQMVADLMRVLPPEWMQNADPVKGAAVP